MDYSLVKAQSPSHSVQKFKLRRRRGVQHYPIKAPQKSRLLSCVLDYKWVSFRVGAIVPTFFVKIILSLHTGFFKTV